MSVLDPHHPFFRHPATRWATVMLPILWSFFEFYQDAPIWGLIFLAAGLYAGWMLLIIRPRRTEGEAKQSDPADS